MDLQGLQVLLDRLARQVLLDRLALPGLDSRGSSSSRSVRARCSSTLEATPLVRVRMVSLAT
jgi:hypothetical protein